MNSYLLIITTRAPYFSSSAMDAYEAALGASNIGLTVKYLFMHQGVLQLISDQNPVNIGHKNLFKKLTALPLFDVEDLYAYEPSLHNYKVSLSPEKLSLTKLDNTGFTSLCEKAEHVLVF